jgi:hypothetical protein
MLACSPERMFMPTCMPLLLPKLTCSATALPLPINHLLQLLQLGFYLQHGALRSNVLDLRHLTRLTSLDSGGMLGIRLRDGDMLPASLQELTVSDCLSVQPLAPLRQLQVDYAHAELAQHIAALRCKLYSAEGSVMARSGASTRMVARSSSRRPASCSSSMPERCLPMLTKLLLSGGNFSDSMVTPAVVEAWLALQPALQCLDIQYVPSAMAEPVLQQLPKLQGLTQLVLSHCDCFGVEPAELDAVLATLTGLQDLSLCR